MRKLNFNRRRVISGLAAITGGVFASRSIAKVSRTADSAEGPFYPTESMRFNDTDNDLVKIEGQVEKAGGEILHLRGLVTDTNGSPVPDVRVEIWQCDVGGKYLHTSDPRKVNYDNGFQGFGYDITGSDGAYYFRTIKPVSYPGRTPHIHVKCIASGKALLTTQFYLQGDSQNTGDSLFRRLSKVDVESVSMDLIAGPDGLETTVNIVV